MNPPLSSNFTASVVRSTSLLRLNLNETDTLLFAPTFLYLWVPCRFVSPPFVGNFGPQNALPYLKAHVVIRVIIKHHGSYSPVHRLTMLKVNNISSSIQHLSMYTITIHLSYLSRHLSQSMHLVPTLHYSTVQYIAICLLTSSISCGLLVAIKTIPSCFSISVSSAFSNRSPPPKLRALRRMLANFKSCSLVVLT